LAPYSRWRGEIAEYLEDVVMSMALLIVAGVGACAVVASLLALVAAGLVFWRRQDTAGK
jgi:hypothetical protein